LSETSERFGKILGYKLLENMIKFKIYSKTQNSELQKPCVATIGKFDGVHLGHQKLLKLLIKEGLESGLVPTVITFDPHPKEYFSAKVEFQLLQTLEEKVEKILNLGIVQVVVLEFNEFLEKLNAQDFFREVIINKLDVKSILVGEDFRFGKAKHCGINCLIELCTEHRTGLQVVEIACENGEPISSSRIRKERFGE
jgi:riboflavin kinase / FMN adenylyltransferase